MKPGCREKQAKTQPVILEPEHDGLRVLARLIVRRHMQRITAKQQSKNGVPKEELKDILDSGM